MRTYATVPDDHTETHKCMSTSAVGIFFGTIQVEAQLLDRPLEEPFHVDILFVCQCAYILFGVNTKVLQSFTILICDSSTIVIPLDEACYGANSRTPLNMLKVPVAAFLDRPFILIVRPLLGRPPLPRRRINSQAVTFVA